MAGIVRESEIHLYYCKDCKQYPSEISFNDEAHPWAVRTFKMSDHIEERAFSSSRKTSGNEDVRCYPGAKVSGVWECFSNDTIAKIAKENLAKKKHECRTPSTLRRLASTLHLTSDKSDKKDQGKNQGV